MQEEYLMWQIFTVLGTIHKFAQKKESAILANPLILYGAGGENRTLTGSPPRDFESRASTYSATPALENYAFMENPGKCQYRGS
jgi:hypothetical protein